MKEKWIDLVSLTQRFHMCDECEYAVVEDISIINKEVYLYNLRIALRSVGHKITKITKFWNKEDNLDFIIYTTTITKEQHEIALDLYSNFEAEISFDRHENQSESEDENDDDSTDPI